MSLKNLFRLRHTLVFRLTVWYTSIFTISAFIAFFVFYLLITSMVNDRSDQDLLNEAKEFSSLMAVKGVGEVKTAMVLEAESEGVEKIFFRLLAPNGVQFASSNMSSWSDMGISRVALKRIMNGSDHVFETLTIPHNPHKVRLLYSIIGPGRILQIGQSQEDNEKFLVAFRKIFGTTLLILIVFAALIGRFMAKRALRGVDEVTKTTILIANGDFDSRVQVGGRGEEIDRLATTFNNMLERIQTLINGMREMTDNIAHDLRSPITRIRGIAETTLLTGEFDAKCEIMGGSIVEECDRLLGIINTMLDISETEAGVAKLEMSEIDIAEMVRDASELFQPVAEDKDIRIVQKVVSSVFVHGDNKKLQRVLANLLDNALKYTPRGGTITVSVDGDEDQVVLSVNDTGIGISEKDLPHVFKRFYRCDPSRSRDGIGLGLSLAQAIARAHEGDISAESVLHKGSTFTIHLPRSSHHSDSH